MFFTNLSILLLPILKEGIAMINHSQFIGQKFGYLTLHEIYSAKDTIGQNQKYRACTCKCTPTKYLNIRLDDILNTIFI